ncbi:MAG: branched-chain amino acid aminotransferase [Balneolaceae bacterium]
MKDSTSVLESEPERPRQPIQIREAGKSKLDQVDLDNPGFGTIFSDHMAVVKYQDGAWGAPKIEPYQSFACPPALIALHYGQTVFEGMKAFRTNDGEIRLFRPREHMQRLNRSCQRLCIPEQNENQLIELLGTLVRKDSAWVPKRRGNALYIRPLVFGADEFIGLKPASSYTCFIITCPVGAYYKEGIKPVSLTTNPKYVRAVRGGAGGAKTACNYGPALLPAKEAQEQGFTQLLWLDAAEHRYIEEVGTMNIFFRFRDKLVTPPTQGTILPGITRNSVIELAKSWDIPVEERRIAIDEVFEAHENGELLEIFGSGTAAVISSVGKIFHDRRTLEIDMENPGEFTSRLYKEITGIQYGEIEDRFGWMSPVT